MTNSKFQIPAFAGALRAGRPNKLQISISNDLNDFVWDFGHSDLSGIWCLGLGAYIFQRRSL